MPEKVWEMGDQTELGIKMTQIHYRIEEMNRLLVYKDLRDFRISCLNKYYKLNFIKSSCIKGLEKVKIESR